MGHPAIVTVILVVVMVIVYGSLLHQEWGKPTQPRGRDADKKRFGEIPVWRRGCTVVVSAGSVIEQLLAQDLDDATLSFTIVGELAKAQLQLVPTGPTSADIQLKSPLDREVSDWKLLSNEGGKNVQELLHKRVFRRRSVRLLSWLRGTEKTLACLSRCNRTHYLGAPNEVGLRQLPTQHRILISKDFRWHVSRSGHLGSTLGLSSSSCWCRKHIKTITSVWGPNEGIGIGHPQTCGPVL